jgi:hypothetical protein
MATSEGVDAAFTALFLAGVRPADGWRRAAAIAFWAANLPPEMTDKQLRDAAIAYTMLPGHNAFWPTPGRLVELAAAQSGADMLDAAEGAWGYVCRLVREHGRHGPRMLDHKPAPATRRIRRWNPRTRAHEVLDVEIPALVEAWTLHPDPAHRARLEAALSAIGPDPWAQLCDATGDALDWHRKAFCSAYGALLRQRTHGAALGIPEAIPARLVEARADALDRARALDFSAELARRELTRRGGR